MSCERRRLRCDDEFERLLLEEIWNTVKSLLFESRSESSEMKLVNKCYKNLNELGVSAELQFTY